MAGKDTVGSLAKFISEFNSQLSSSRTGSLAQIWMPEAGEDGSIVLNTQGLPYSINGVGDLLALFRCISCKYKFSTDVTKTHQMGAVGRVFTSGEPEMSGHVQRYDQHVYLRAAEAQRCRVHSTLFMPIYATRNRDSCLAVFEVVMTDADVNFAGMVGWIISCLQTEGLYTAEMDTSSIQNQRMGLRNLGATEYDGMSALESGVAAAAARPTLGAGTTGMRMGGSDDGAERQQGAAGAGPAGSLDLLRAAAAPAPPQVQAQAQPPRAEMEAAVGQVAVGDGLGGSSSDEFQAAKRLRVGGSGSNGQDGGNRAGLQRMMSGAEGMPSPAPQQQPMMAGNGSGSGGGSGGQQAQQPPQPLHQPMQQQGSHRLSGSLDGRSPLLGSGSLQGIMNAMNGSGHPSASAGLPSGSTAPAAQGTENTPLVPLVAAAVQQLLSQPSPNPQLAALLGPQGVQSSLQASLGGQFVSLAGGGSQLLSEPSPAVTAGLRASQQQQQQQEGGNEGEDVGDDTDDEKAFLRPTPGAAQKYGQGNRILTYDDLAAQFGYGLKEAAARLNICPTTLKRACRRLGIPRWPRRELVKHKKQKNAVRTEGGSGGGSQQQQQQQNGGAPQLGNGSLAKGQGFSSGSGPSSGGSGNPQLMIAAAAAASHQQLGQHGGNSLLSSLQALQGLQGIEQLLPAAAGLPGDFAAVLASSLQPPPQQQHMQQADPSPAANPNLVGQVMQLLQQQQQQQQPHSSPGPGWQPSLPQLQLQLPPPQAQGNGALPPGAHRLPASLAQGGAAPSLQLHAGGMGAPPLPSGLARLSPGLMPPAPLLSNLGLPRRADSKLQSVGQGMGSLDILAAADLDVSVGNMSVGNSPRLALSNLGGLSQLGFSGFDFGGAVAGGGGGGPAATNTGGAGATGPQNDPAFSTGAMPLPQPAHK